MFRLWKFLIYILIGFLIGMAFIEPPKKEDLYTVYRLDKNFVYSTVAGEYLSTNVKLLDACLYLKYVSSEIADVTISKLQDKEYIFKTLEGGEFSIIDIKESELIPDVVFVKVVGVANTTKFWVSLDSLIQIGNE